MLIYFKFFILFDRTDDLKSGTLVGEDKYGNRYYENNMYFVGKLLINMNIGLNVLNNVDTRRKLVVVDYAIQFILRIKRLSIPASVTNICAQS